MATEKTPNYSAAQEALIREFVAANGGVGNKSVAEALAADARMNGDEGPRGYRSIIAKMNRMSDINYERVQPTTKDGKPVQKKLDLVKRIAEAAGVSVKALDGLEKAPKLALETLANMADELADARDAADEDREAA